MPTRAEASRANGAKSKGPKSEETRAKSSANSLRHGLTSRHTILLSCEDSAEFQQLSDEYEQLYLPASVVEVELVKSMIAARWRIGRLWTIEATLLDNQIANPQASEFEDTTAFDALDAPSQMAQAFFQLADESHAMSLISRYEARLERTHARALSTLRELRERPIPAPVSQPQPPAAAIEPEPRPASPKPEAKENAKTKSAKTNPSPVVPFPITGARD